MGNSYMLLGQNLTQTWYFWNSTGWLSGTYIVRIRAHSVDLTMSKCAVNDPPSSYWPGDFSDAISSPFEAGDVAHGDVGLYFLKVNVESNSTYILNSTENYLIVYLTFIREIPSRVQYTIRDNGTFWRDEAFYPKSSSETQTMTVNIDGLSLGFHILELLIQDYSQIQHFTIPINVTEEFTQPVIPIDLSPYLQAFIVGISVGSGVVIAIVIYLTLRLRRNRGVIYV